MPSKYQIAYEEERKKKDQPATGISSGTTFDAAPDQQVVTPQENLAQKHNIASASSSNKSKYQIAYEAEKSTGEDSMSAWEYVKEAITGAKRTTPEIEKLPEVLSAGGLTIRGGIGKNLKVAAGLLLSHDDKTQMQVIKGAAPETEFRVDDKGNVIGNYDGKEFVLNKPGFSFADAQRTVVDMAAFLPAAKFAAIGNGLLAKMGLAAAGTAATERGLGEVREALGGEEQTGMFSGETLPAAGFAMAAEIPVPVAGAILRRAKPYAETFVSRLGAKELASKIAKTGVVIDEDILENLTRSERASAESGIDFLPTQATGIKADDILQRVLTEQPASSKTIGKFIEKQDEQSRNAIYNFLGRVAPTSSLVEGPAKFKKAAITAIDKLKTQRKNETDSVYRTLFQDPPDVDINPVINTIKQEMESFRPEGTVYKKLAKAMQLVGGKAKKVTLYDARGNKISSDAYDKVSLDILHNAKLEIDDMINGVGDRAVSSTAKRKLTTIKEKLLGVMEDPDMGGSPAYGEVRNKFAELSAPIDQLQESLIGRASQLKDADLRKMSNIIFNPAESNAETLINVKKVIDSADPEAFPMLLRSSIEEKIESISKRAKNAPNEFSVALFKNDKQRRMMLSVMNPQQRQNAQWLEKALDIAAIGRTAGSDTAAKSQIISKLSGTVAAPIIGIIAPAATFGSVGAALSGARLLSTALRKKTLDKRVKVLADVLVNEKWSKDMARIRKLGLQTPAAMRQLAQLLNNVDAGLEKDDEAKLKEQGVTFRMD